MHDLFATGALDAHVHISRDTDCMVGHLARRVPPGLLRRVAAAAATA